MAFKRREVFEDGGITRYADQKFHNCPFCGTQFPNWLTDAYFVKHSLTQSECINGYKFQCEKCRGVFEIQANGDYCFVNESFISVKLINSGRGSKNTNKIGIPITIEELEKMSIESTTAPTYQTPYQQQPAYQYPNYLYKRPSTAGKVLSLISMITGIVTLAITFLFFLASLSIYEMGMFTFIFGIYGIAPIILGAIGADKNKDEKGKAITGIVLGSLSIFFGFLAFVSFISYAFY